MATWPISQVVRIIYFNLDWLCIGSHAHTHTHRGVIEIVHGRKKKDLSRPSVAVIYTYNTLTDVLYKN